jgi:murein DD-endopeptidase MepM/ murein hydrolase activator NlpD
MAGRTFDSVTEVLSRAFPERRIYIRSDARTRYWTIGPVSQCGLAFVLAAGVAWSGFTSYVYIHGAMDGRTAESRLAASEEAYEIQLAALREQQKILEEELNRSNARGDAVTRELSEKQRLLVDTANSYQTARAELEGLRAEVEALSSERRDELAEINALNEELVELRLALAEAAQRDAAMDETLATFSRSITDVIAARDSAEAHVETLDLRVAELESEVGAWQGRQESLLAQLEEATQSSLESLDSIFVDAELDLEDILSRAREDYTGRGGTYEPVGPIEPIEPIEPVVDDRHSALEPAAEPKPPDGVRVASLMNDLERVSLMRVAIGRLPFGMPTEGARITSGFGVRSDPYRRRKAMHYGLDLAAPTGTPIYATAEGVVTFAGRQSGYGNVVKIRHAFGFETLYGHLSKSRVQVGQRVRRGMLIADMGSTGRSTGSHLHYEVRIDGQPVNPTKFIRAARNVL